MEWPGHLFYDGLSAGRPALRHPLRATYSPLGVIKPYHVAGNYSIDFGNQRLESVIVGFLAAFSAKFDCHMI